MKTFLENLNQDTDESRKTNWENHRKQVTVLFDEVFSGKDYVNKIAIFGAGNCDDLDLGHLASRCNTIYLFDYDSESIESGIENLQEDLRRKIKIVEMDFTGLDTINFYENFTSMLENSEKTKKIKKYLIKTANQLNEVSKDKWMEFNNSFDIVASSAIYTQLFYNWALQTLFEFEVNYDKSEINQLIDELVYFRNKVVLSYNNSLDKSCNREGHLIAWSDILEVQSSHVNIINTGMKEALNFASKYGLGVGVLGVKDLSSKMDRTNLLMRKWQWDFTNNKQYLTIGICGKLKNS